MRRASLPMALGLSLASLPACKSDPAPSPPASAAPAVTAAGAASSASSATAANAASSDSPFSIAARSSDPIALYGLKGAAFVDAAGFLAILGEGPLRQVPATMKGLEKGQSGQILGIYPDGAWLVASDGAYKWTNDRWAENKILREGETFLDIAAWNERAVAAIAMPNNDMRFFLVGGKGGVVVPGPYPADKPKPAVADGTGSTGSAGSTGDPAAAPAPSAAPEGEPKPDDASCKVKMKPERVMLGGLPTGQLYAAGYECQEAGRGAPIVERWEPKKVRGTVEPLPKPEGAGAEVTPRGVLARSPTEVFVYGSSGTPVAPYLARFDGKAWSLDKAALGGDIQDLEAADDGAIWAVAGGAVWKKAVSAEWMKVPLPAGLEAKRVWPRTAADVWVTARGPAGGVLLRTAKVDAKDVADLPARKAMEDTIATNRRFYATPVCDKPYAHLSTLGPSKDPGTGKPADAPKDFSALKPVFTGEFEGLKPIVEDDGAHLYVGVPVPSMEVGRKLIAAYREKNAKGAPNLFCHEPVIVKQAIFFK